MSGSDFNISVPLSSDLSYKWQNNSTNSSLNFTEANGSQLVVGSYNFSVELKNNTTGCTNIIGPVEVKVNGLPSGIQIKTNSNGLLCEGQNHTFEVVNPMPDVKYTWNTGKKTPSITTNLAGKYFVKAKDINGCQGLSNVLEIIAGPDVSLVPSGCFERCAPDSLCFPGISGVSSYNWLKNGVTIPSNQGGNTPYIILNESASYTLELTGSNGCKNTSEPLSLTLNQAIGNIRIRSFSDVNANNVIDGGDTLLQNVDLTVGGYTLFDQAGISNFSVPYGSYIVAFNESWIPEGAKAIIDSLTANIRSCNDSLFVDLLLGFNCFAKNTTENHNICFGKKYELEGNVYQKDTTIVLAKMNPSGCIDTTRHIVKFTNEIVFSLNATYSCPNKNDANIGLELLSSDTYKYYINGAETELTGASFKNFGAGNYLIEIVDQYGCKASESIQIIDRQAVEYELVANDISCIDGFTVLKVKLKKLY
ncbi:MAG: hypothetical protein IPO92_16955 [Saprospiraceae bacterium]|nr:hypothetical protein [Saprospiraceae bacterium]